MWCLVSQLLVSATFLEGPARFQPHWPHEPLDWRLGWAGTKEPWDEQGGLPPDSILGSLSDLCSNSLDCRAWTRLIGWMDQLTRNGHRIRSYPNRQKRRLTTSLEFPGREQHLRKAGDSGEGKHCDSLWMIVNAWLLIERNERNFSVWKLQNQFFLHMQLKKKN